MPTGLVVHLDIQPDHLDEFVSIARAHAQTTLAQEADCLTFQVMLAQEIPNRVILVEVYTDDDALEAHWKSEHMIDYLRRVDGMINNRQRFRCLA